MIEFRNSNQMKAYMKKEARRLNININNVYTTFVARTLLERLSKSGNDDILIKGSSAEVAYLGNLVRAITDVDIAVLTEYKKCQNDIFNIFGENINDCFNYTLVKDPKKTPTGIYQLSTEVKFDKMRQPLGIDLQDNYNRLIEKETRIMPAIFEGDEPFEIITPSFEEYLADKMCIILESNKPDVLNTRVKDFYDIYQLHGGKYDSDKLTEYFRKILKLRGKISIEDADTFYLDKEFINNHDKIWQSTKDKYNFLDKEIDLEGAVYYTRAVLREQLQKNGQLMPNTISNRYIK